MKLRARDSGPIYFGRPLELLEETFKYYEVGGGPGGIKAYNHFEIYHTMNMLYLHGIDI